MSLAALKQADTEMLLVALQKGSTHLLALIKLVRSATVRGDHASPTKHSRVVCAAIAAGRLPQSK